MPIKKPFYKEAKGCAHLHKTRIHCDTTENYTVAKNKDPMDKVNSQEKIMIMEDRTINTNGDLKEKIQVR